jgi:hypothetical protein
MSKRISLTRGKFAIVDDEDYEWLSQWKWHYTKASRGTSDGYACRGIYQDGKTSIISMHRLLMDAPDDLQVDHIDGNGLNNRRSNLRLATPSQQAANRNRWKSSRPFRGVRWVARKKKWRAEITIDGKVRHIGYFHDPIVAALAYDERAIRQFGEFARPNFSDEEKAVLEKRRDEFT